MLKGVDISRYQTPDKKYVRNYDFCIMKASEGKSLKDVNLDKHYDNVRGKSDGKPDGEKLYGFYHYARPDIGNTYQQEADFFLSLVGHHAGNCLFVLDWEGKSLGYETWAKNWLDYVYKITGVKPLIYIQQSQAKLSKYDKIKNGDYGLWIARYNEECIKKKTPYLKDSDKARWGTWALWQFTESPVDTNYFNGTKTQFKKYCERK